MLLHQLKQRDAAIYLFTSMTCLATIVVPSYGLSSSLDLDITFSTAPMSSTLWASAWTYGGYLQLGGMLSAPYQGAQFPDEWIWVDSPPESDSSGDGHVEFVSGLPDAGATASAGAGSASASVSGNNFALSISAGVHLRRQIWETWGIHPDDGQDFLMVLSDRYEYSMSGAGSGGALFFSEPSIIEDITASFSASAGLVNETAWFPVGTNMYWLIHTIDMDPATYVSVYAANQRILSGSYGINGHGTKFATGDFSVVNDEFVVAPVDPITLPAGEINFERATITRIPGDFNGDFAIYADDIDLLAAAILTSPPVSPEPADFESGYPGEVFDPLDINTDDLINALDKDFLIGSLLETLYGDSDLDGTVDSDDLLLVKNNFGSAGGWADADFDGDGIVDIDDLLYVKNNYGQSYIPPGLTFVPEPATLTLMAIGGVMLAARKQI